MNRLTGRWNPRRFRKAEDRATSGQSAQAVCQSRRQPGAGPQPDRGRRGAIEADEIDQDAGEGRAQHVGEGEDAADPAVLRVGEVKLAHHRGRHGGERGAIQIIDRGGEHEDRKHQPAPAVRHWNSMVATSPVVARRALLLAQNSTTMRRAFCAPQPSVCSPPPVIVIWPGLTTSSRSVGPSAD